MKTIAHKEVGSATVCTEIGEKDVYMKILYGEEVIYIDGLEGVCDLMYAVERSMYAIKEYLEAEKLKNG